MRIAEFAREFASLVKKRLGTHYVKVYLLYLRIMSVLLELGEVHISELLNMLEEEIRDRALLGYLIYDLTKLGLISQRGETLHFNYGRYLELRSRLAKGDFEITSLTVLQPLLLLFREYVMKRGLTDKVMRSPRADLSSSNNP